MRAIISLILIVTLSSCGFQAKRNTNTTSQNDTISITTTQKNISNNKISNWGLVKPQIDKNNIRIYDDYNIDSRDEGDYFVLKIVDSEYKLSDIFDYGELDVLVYKNNERHTIICLGMVDLYGSVYFVYYLKNNTLVRLGEINFSQSESVEVEGSKQATFNLEQIDENLIIYLYLDNKLSTQYEFKLNI